ncbi:uncharacterized protein B0H18DRAFT_164166 [Fomitopsis serialis]|uniref:uncharacterized protein n=1 Tax=Fomitopsis serialis TaxID=139415 RepID=UPI0020080D15|nr:uncharacterized protein B0H18DRAFT_164166 [Neoantrodia serialis]KAH9913667.1 hypothetical protein B0H18DRAFT_164166 [Neoantrodia serialis]
MTPALAFLLSLVRLPLPEACMSLCKSEATRRNPRYTILEDGLFRLTLTGNHQCASSHGNDLTRASLDPRRSDALSPRSTPDYSASTFAGRLGPHRRTSV